ncbi:ScbA/BarX family gamma-butyrolactone biosynthesis protein [Streptomyces muensis]|uniref:A-factor biosynthesis protein n=1 Tax=Streptomyces muensis TaxID=1077944 RepID=A0A9X1TL14_STRM4|nr:ScbA/BarX family gamma-butyrolactone biosynthesis protein [Streptomyces muensis]MCF1594610.1 A-factor biosynthesis protein [Streptomyces muensis]
MPEVPVAPRSSSRPRGESPSRLLLGAYTHLKHNDAVLIDSWQRTDEDRFTLRLDWPAAPHGHPYDPRVLTQTIRQSGLAVAHAEYEVPLDHQTLLNWLDVTVSPDFRVPDTEPSTLLVDLTVAPGRSGRRAAHAMHMEIRTSPDDEPVARADTEFGWISPAAYRRVRGDRLTGAWGDWPLPDPVEPGLVRRGQAVDVVLAPTRAPHRWQLRNDVSNVLLFDHPVDHVPGLVLWEAAQQAAQALLAPSVCVPVSVATTYRRYVEFDQPCLIDARVLGPQGPGRVAVRVTGTQGDATAFTADITAVARPAR